MRAAEFGEADQQVGGVVGRIIVLDGRQGAANESSCRSFSLAPEALRSNGEPSMATQRRSKRASVTALVFSDEDRCRTPTNR